MASSVSGQDESNPALWLATPVGKMKLSCPLGTTRCVPQENFPRKPYNKSVVNQACSVKMAGYWPRSFFCEFMDRDSFSVHKLAKTDLGQYPAILTSHLVNNPYIYSNSNSSYSGGFVITAKILQLQPNQFIKISIWQSRLKHLLCSLNARGFYLALINRAGGLCGRILTEVVSTDRTQWGLYTQPRSRFSHTDRLSSVNKMFIIWQRKRL